MVKSSLALVAAAALLGPAAVALAPAHAATSAERVENCSKSGHGVTVRIKLRDNGQFTRVRVSHPRGDGNFYAPRVRQVRGATFGGGDAPPPDENGGQIGGGVWRERERSLGPTFRTESSVGGFVGVSAMFKLRSGHSIRLTCTLD